MRADVSLCPMMSALLLYCKDEKKEGNAADGDGAENYRDVPLRLKVPQTQDIIEANIKNLHNEKFDIPEAEIWPIRDLIPPHQVAGSVGKWKGAIPFIFLDLVDAVLSCVRSSHICCLLVCGLTHRLWCPMERVLLPLPEDIGVE